MSSVRPLPAAAGPSLDPRAPQTCLQERRWSDGGAGRLAARSVRLERPENRPDPLVAVRLEPCLDLPAEHRGLPAAGVVRRHVADRAVDALALPGPGQLAQGPVAN